MILTLQQRLQGGSQPIAAPTSFPPPLKGWNTRDQLDAMDPLDAVTLNNWYPDANGVYIRNGFLPFASGLGTGAVRTLAQFDNGATQKFLAACGGTVFDISGGGTSGVSLGHGFLSDEWQTQNFLQRLFMVNGQDAPQIYDGATLSAASFTGTSLALNSLVGVCLYQQRLYFWADNSPGFWYAELNSLSGTLTYYDLSPFSPNGGKLVAVTTITHDGGNGVLDFIAFMLSNGDTLLYYGNDPSQSSAWQLIGIYRLSPPVSPRAVCTYGGDSFVTTFDDHMPIEQQLVALKVGSLPPRSKVSTAVQQAVALNKNAFGWQALYYPAGRRLIFNIPNPNGTFYQHVCNTGLPDLPWCQFTGMNAYVWALFGDSLYFGAVNGAIYQADIGSTDNLGPVSAYGQQAWNKLGNARRKRVSAVRPVVQTQGSIAYNFGVGFDYRPLDVDIPILTEGNLGSPWNISPWNTSPWSPETTVDPRWSIGGGSGTAVGFAIAAATVEQVSWLRTDMRFESGDAL